MANLKKEDALTRTKPTRVTIFAIVAAAVSVGYIMTLAILAPEQLAEATAAASDLVCSGCVGTTDIADSAVTSAKIGSSQVGNSDIASNAVGSGKIADGQVKAPDIATDAVQAAEIGSSQVGNSEIANDAVTSAKIGSGQVGNSDIASNAINTAKIADGQVTGNDIASQPFGVGTGDINNGAVNTEDLATGAIQLNAHIVEGDGAEVPSLGTGKDEVDCPPGEILTGGGFASGGTNVNVLVSRPLDENTWQVDAINGPSTITAYALCIDPSLP
jgi:hypothetical protein